MTTKTGEKAGNVEHVLMLALSLLPLACASIYWSGFVQERVIQVVTNCSARPLL